MRFLDLTRRYRESELMDQPGLERERHEQALKGLGHINSITRSSATLWPEIRNLAESRHPSPLRVLDMACGGGDVAIALTRRANRAGYNIQLDGFDISPVAIAYAKRQAEVQSVDLHFHQQNALDGPLPSGYDVVMCSLFLHHLDDSEAVLLLRRMAEAAGQLVLVYDLIRSRLGYGLAWVGTRLLSRSPIVQIDGPRSVRAAFTVSEARDLAEQAGLTGAKASCHWPERFLLRWKRVGYD